MDRRDFLVDVVAAAALALACGTLPATAARIEPRRGASKWFDDRAELIKYLRTTLGVPLEVRGLEHAGSHPIEQIFADVPDAQAGYVGFWMPELKMGAVIGPNVEEAAELIHTMGDPASDSRRR